MMLRGAAALLSASALIAHSAAADPGVALAAPGDCATPIADFVAPPVYGQSAGVPGPASDHFAPSSGPADVQRLLPLDLTRTTAVTGSVNLVETTTTGVGAVVENTLNGTGGLANQTIGNVNTIANGALTNLDLGGGGSALGQEPVNTLNGVVRTGTDLGTQTLGIVNGALSNPLPGGN